EHGGGGGVGGGGGAARSEPAADAGGREAGAPTVELAGAGGGSGGGGRRRAERRLGRPARPGSMAGRPDRGRDRGSGRTGIQRRGTHTQFEQPLQPNPDLGQWEPSERREQHLGLGQHPG